MHDFRFLSSTSALASHYLAYCFFRSILPGFTLQLFSQCSTSLSIHRFPLSLWPDLSCLRSRFLYLAFCLFPFALSWFTPTAVSQVIPLCFRFRDFPLPVHFLSSVSFLLQATQLSVPSVLFFLIPSLSDFLSASSFPFGSDVFYLIFHLVSHISFQVSDTWLSVCFLSSFPASLPQLFYRCFPLSTSLRPFLCRDFLLAFSFLSSALARFWLLSFLAFFSLLLDLTCQRFFSMYVFLFSPACFHAFLLILVLSSLQFLLPTIVSPHSCYFNVPAFSFRILADFPWLSL